MIDASFAVIALRVFRLRRRDFAPPGPASCRIRRAISAGIVPDRRAADMGDAQGGAGSKARAMPRAARLRAARLLWSNDLRRNRGASHLSGVIFTLRQRG